VVISAGVVITALNQKWPFRTALFPVVIGSAVFIMAAAETLLSIFGKEKMPADEPEMDLKFSEDMDQATETRRTLLAFAWINGFFMLIFFFGFSIAVPLFVLLYFKLQSKEAWGISVILTGVAWGFFYGLFVLLLNIHFPEGWLLRILV
jgi:hypothetical protein